MQAWLTTIVGRVCLNVLRSRKSRREELSGRVPDPVLSLDESVDPEQQALLADSVGLAMLVVLNALTPAERLAFVMHDVLAVPFAEIATVLDRSESAVQQLASRARRRVRGGPEPDPDVARQREIVDAFFAASRDGDFDALVAIPTSNSGSMAARCARKPPWFSAVRRPWQGTRPPTPSSTRSSDRPLSTAPLGP